MPYARRNEKGKMHKKHVESTIELQSWQKVKKDYILHSTVKKQDKRSVPGYH